MSKWRKASDEDTSDRSQSDEGSDEDSGSGSDESGSNSDEPSDSGSSSGSGSGSGSGSSSEEEDGSSSDGSDGNEDSDDEESEEGDQEKKLANKREDYEKMRELCVHMDNIVQRLANFFPQDRNDEGISPTPPVPELPPLPKPEPLKDVIDRSVPARAITMDRAVSARKLTIDRSVSAASGLRFDDDLSDPVALNSKHEESAEGQGQGAKTQHRSTGEGWRRGEDGAVSSAGDRNRRTEANAPQENRAGIDSWSGNDRNVDEDKDRGAKREAGGGRRRSDTQSDNPSPNFAPEELNERLLWDELRESLAEVSESDVLRSKRGSGSTTGKSGGNRDSYERRRRRLIDEAIAVLLEDDSSEEEG